MSIASLSHFYTALSLENVMKNVEKSSFKVQICSNHEKRERFGERIGKDALLGGLLMFVSNINGHNIQQ